MPPEPPGQILDNRYDVGDRIGVGGMGEVRAGFDRRLRRDVAIKFLRADLAEQPDVRRRFEYETKSAARLGHPGAVTVFDGGEADGIPYLVMELLPGRTLADRLAAGQVLPEHEVTNIGLDVLDALEEAHRIGVLHRDVKPGNLLYTEDGRVKLADFGIAKSVEALDHTATGELMGTAAYMAPERLHGAAATPASDIYSVGVVVYEALVGRKPYRGDTPIAVAYAMHAGDHEPIENARPGIDRNLAAAITRALAADPEHRFGSAAEMAVVLRASEIGPVNAAETATQRMSTAPPVAARSGNTERYVGPVAAPPEPDRRRSAQIRPIAGAAAAAGLLVLLIGVALIINRDRDEPVGNDEDPQTTTTTAPGTEPLPEDLERAIRDLERLVEG